MNFPKNDLICSYLVTLSTGTYKIVLLHLGTFILTKLKLLCGDADWSWNYPLPKTNRSYIGIFSVGLDLHVSNAIKKIFLLRTSSSLSFKCMLYILNNMQNILVNCSWWWWSFVQKNNYMYAPGQNFKNIIFFQRR